MSKKILVVDDISEYAIVLQMYFPDDAEVFTATNIDEAKAVFLKTENIDLAIVDIRLNEKDTSDTSGMELLRWIKENYQSTEVVMISAYMSSEYEMEALERGAFCFIKKPLQPEIIREMLRKLGG
ncbi:MAG: response regulator [Kiritimatiellae bacterium]|jgi:two-component system response regulator YesN|nr:response regulator [Kiritimatiellia bacterium]